MDTRVQRDVLLRGSVASLLPEPLQEEGRPNGIALACKYDSAALAVSTVSASRRAASVQGKCPAFFEAQFLGRLTPGLRINSEA